MISNKKEQQSTSELHAAKSFKRKRPHADDRIEIYRKIRIFSLPNGLLTGEKIVSYHRLPHDDELYVMKAFARHASHCSTCAHPYETYRKGDTLCSKGHQRAFDVAQYVFNKAGQTFSVVDHYNNRRVSMEIPADCPVVLELLKTLESGFRLRRKVSISYDKTYHVKSRQPIEGTTAQRETHSYEIQREFDMSHSFDLK